MGLCREHAWQHWPAESCEVHRRRCNIYVGALVEEAFARNADPAETHEAERLVISNHGGGSAPKKIEHVK